MTRAPARSPANAFVCARVKSFSTSIESSFSAANAESSRASVTASAALIALPRYNRSFVVTYAFTCSKRASLSRACEAPFAAACR